MSELLNIYSTVEDALADHLEGRESSLAVASRPGLHDRSAGRDDAEIIRSEIEQLDNAIREILATGSSGADHETGESVDTSAVEVGAPRIGQAAQPTREVSLLPVTIYLSEETGHELVQAAVENLLNEVGLRIESRDEPVIGSWFRQMWAAAGRSMRTPIAREGALVAAHMADTRLVLAQDAVITSKLMENLPPLIESLSPPRMP